MNKTKNKIEKNDNNKEKEQHQDITLKTNRNKSNITSRTRKQLEQRWTRTTRIETRTTKWPSRKSRLSWRRREQQQEQQDEKSWCTDSSSCVLSCTWTCWIFTSCFPSCTGAHTGIIEPPTQQQLMGENQRTRSAVGRPADPEELWCHKWLSNQRPCLPLCVQTVNNLCLSASDPLKSLSFRQFLLRILLKCTCWHVQMCSRVGRYYRAHELARTDVFMYLHKDCHNIRFSLHDYRGQKNSR